MELVLAGSAAQLHSPVFNSKLKSLVRDFSRSRLHSLKFRSRHRSIDYSFHNFHKRLTLMRAKPLQSSLSSNSEETSKLAILLEVEGYCFTTLQNFIPFQSCTSFAICFGKQREGDFKSLTCCVLYQ